MNTHFTTDIAIIGGGTIGLAAAYYAAQRGYKTTLFEQANLSNPKAGSDGGSRMFRVMYSEPNMARLTEAAGSMGSDSIDFRRGLTLGRRDRSQFGADLKIGAVGRIRPA